MDYFEAVGALHRLELLRRIKARSLMADSGLHPGQPRLLEYIRCHPGCTQKEAADELDVTPASAAASLKRLEKAGYVTRTQDDKDARRNQLYITEPGLARMEEHCRQFGALDERMFAGMTDGEVAAFRNVCEKMFDNLADEGDRHLTIWKLARKAQEEEEGENT
ncbi:MAG: winged helix-turn-helix transcriptional regulator [Clostridia bacterium]|nr:winged helix-turn-helix transcriptional regulator [Clostridia bacterium]